jgi:hypothetical protein
MYVSEVKWVQGYLVFLKLNDVYWRCHINLIEGVVQYLDL